MVNGDFCRFSEGKLDAKTEKIHIRRVYPHTCWIILACIVSIVTAYIAFRLCIDKQSSIADRISCGAIFATFGSALATICSLNITKFYERFKENYVVLMNEILECKGWKRWPFVKRQSHKVLYANKSYYEQVTQAKIVFDSQALNLSVSIPTVLEDFYDLPIWKDKWEMGRSRISFEQNVLGHCKDHKGETLSAWDCVYDSLRAIINYRITHVFLYAGCVLTITSFILTIASCLFRV